MREVAGGSTPEAGGRKPEAGSRRPEAGSRKPEAGTRVRSDRLPPMTPAGGVGVIALLPDPELLHLLVPKVLTARARSVSDKKGRGVRVALLAVIGVALLGFHISDCCTSCSCISVAFRRSGRSFRESCWG